jgi:hypothetical protein
MVDHIRSVILLILLRAIPLTPSRLVDGESARKLSKDMPFSPPAQVHCTISNAPFRVNPVRTEVISWDVLKIPKVFPIVTYLKAF